VFVMPDRCPHDGGRLSDGFLEGEIIVCSRHGWEFELPAGRCVGRPNVAIASKPVKSADS
jgi:nitrite reductase (NADH) small subunit